MALRIGFDLDGTLADMHHSLRLEAERLFGSDDVSADNTARQSAADDEQGALMSAGLPLTRQQQTALWERVRQITNFWDSLREMQPGIVARLAEIAVARRWEVIFLTTRPLVAGDTVQRQSQRWLERHGFPLPSVFVVHRSRGPIAEALELDAVVDDRAENCLDVTLDSKALAVLISSDGAKSAPLGLDRLGGRIVPTIAEALDLLIEMDDAKGGSGLSRTLKKFFRREPAS